LLRFAPMLRACGASRWADKKTDALYAHCAYPAHRPGSLPLASGAVLPAIFRPYVATSLPQGRFPVKGEAIRAAWATDLSTCPAKVLRCGVSPCNEAGFYHRGDFCQDRAGQRSLTLGIRQATGIWPDHTRVHGGRVVIYCQEMPSSGQGERAWADPRGQLPTGGRCRDSDTSPRTDQAAGPRLLTRWKSEADGTVRMEEEVLCVSESDAPKLSFGASCMEAEG